MRRRADLAAGRARAIAQLADGIRGAARLALRAFHLAPETLDPALQFGRQAAGVLGQQLLALEAAHGRLKLLDLGRDLRHAAHAQLLEGGLQGRAQRAAFGTHLAHHLHIVGGLALGLDQRSAQLGLLIA